MTALFTIGYEGRQLDEVIAMLQSHAIDRVLDVRQLPLSRRRGFSKTPLSAALAPVGIEYVHLREAGNPYRAARASMPRDELLARYRMHLNSHRGIVGRVSEHVVSHRAAPLLRVRPEHVSPNGPRRAHRPAARRCGARAVAPAHAHSARPDRGAFAASAR